MTKDRDRMIRARKTREAKEPAEVRMSDQEIIAQVDRELLKEKIKEERRLNERQNEIVQLTLWWQEAMSKASNFSDAYKCTVQFLQTFPFRFHGEKEHKEIEQLRYAMLHQDHSISQIVSDHNYDLQFLSLLITENIVPSDLAQSLSDFLESRLFARLQNGGHETWLDSLHSGNYSLIVRHSAIDVAILGSASR